MTPFERRDIRCIAVLGLGSIGLRHAQNARQLGLNVVGFDPCSQACDEAKAHEIQIAAAAEQAIAAADAVVIASPSGCHLDDLELCVAKRRPALVEKPIGHDPKRTAALLERAEAQSLPIGSVFNLRQRSVVRTLREMVSNRLGDLVWARFVSASWLPDWRPGQDYRTGYASDPASGGVVFDVIHELDLAGFLIGPAEVASSVLRRSGRLELVPEDTAEIVLAHTGGCLSSLHLNYASPVRRRSAEICGTQGIVTADLRTGEIRWCDRQGHTIETMVVEIDPAAEYLTVLSDFVEALGAGLPQKCDGYAGLAAVRLADRARSISADTPVPAAVF